jgi:hypothetical protein
MFSEEKVKYICEACINHISRMCSLNDSSMRRLCATKECSFVTVNSWLSGLYGEWSVLVTWYCWLHERNFHRNQNNTFSLLSGNISKEHSKLMDERSKI